MNPGELQQLLGLLFTIVQGGDGRYLKIRTPFHFPDGEVIEAFYAAQLARVTDLGRTNDYLRTHFLQQPLLAEELKALRADIGLSYGVVFSRGAMNVTVADKATVAIAIMNLAQASLSYVCLAGATSAKLELTMNNEKGGLASPPKAEPGLDRQLPHEPVAWAEDAKALWIEDGAGNLAILPPPGVEAEPLRIGRAIPGLDELLPLIPRWDGDLLASSALTQALSRHHLTLILRPLRGFDPERGYYVSRHPYVKG